MASDTAGPLARQALDLAKNALLVNLRFMNAAFARLHPFPVPGATLATDEASAALALSPVSEERQRAKTASPMSVRGEPSSSAATTVHLPVPF